MTSLLRDPISMLIRKVIGHHMYYSQEELESKQLLNKQEVHECFNRLRILINSHEIEQSRDYLNVLSELILKVYPDSNWDAHIIPHLPPSKPTGMTPDQVIPSAYFKFSLNIEKCCFCQGEIPRRVTGRGLFMTKDYKFKWCEDCATPAHKNNEFYLKYHK